MIRKAGVLLLGCVLLVVGYHRYQLAAGAGDEPIEVDLAAIEAGHELSSRYIVVGPHVRLYWMAAVEYDLPRSGQDDLEHRRIGDVFYPIVPVHAAPGRRLPEPGSLTFRVLVRTDDFRDQWADTHRIPKMKRMNQLSGFVYGGIEELDTRARRLLHKAYPALDLERIVIVEEGGGPPSRVFAFVLMGAGGFIVLATLAAAVAGRRRGRGPRGSATV